MAKVVTSAKTKLFIAGVHAEATDSAAEYAALTWVEVGEVTNFGEFGAQYAEITHTPVGNPTVQKFKGSLNQGTISLTLGRVPVDAGQEDLRAALASYDSYDFKIELNDKPAGVSAKPTTFYFPGKVMSYTTSIGGPDQVVTATANIGIDGDIIEVAATTGV